MLVVLISLNVFCWLREAEDIKVFSNKVQVNIDPDKFTESEFDIPRKVHMRII